ncbi:hypothetical protein GCM10010404_10140 [Nonomuraea africana]
MRVRLDPGVEAEAARGNIIGALYTGSVASVVYAYMSGVIPKVTVVYEIPRNFVPVDGRSPGGGSRLLRRRRGRARDTVAAGACTAPEGTGSAAGTAAAALGQP